MARRRWGRSRGRSMADIFVSYTSSDRDWAFWIGQELEELGHKAHIHEWEISGGGNVMAWMTARADAAAHVLCVVSEKYFEGALFEFGTYGGGMGRNQEAAKFCAAGFCRALRTARTLCASETLRSLWPGRG